MNVPKLFGLVSAAWAAMAVACEAVNICLTKHCSVAIFVRQCSHGFSSRWAKTGEKA